MGQPKTSKILWSAVSYRELSSALDYPGPLVSLCPVQVTNDIFIQLGHGQNNDYECVSVHKWESVHECE
jgi:hypothetical protein